MRLSFVWLLIFIISFSMYGKQALVYNDTIYVYEEVIVYDTVYMYDTVQFSNYDDTLLTQQHLPFTILEIDTVNHSANLLLIDSLSATIPINNIILNRNIKNYGNMKKLGFLGVVFLAFQSMVVAQTQFEVSLGSGIWFQTGYVPDLDRPYSPIADVGIYARKNIFNNNFALKTGINYSFLFSTGTYEDINQAVRTRPWYVSEIRGHYEHQHQSLSIPLLFYYYKYRLKPFIGINYNYLFTQRFSRRYSSGESTYNHVYASSNFGLNAGIACAVSNRVSVEVMYKHNLTPDLKLYEEPVISGTTRLPGMTYYLKNNQIKLTVSYMLNKIN